MERMHYVAHAEALSAEQRQQYSLGPNDDSAHFLMTKLAPHRATGPVAALQAEVMALAGSILTLTPEAAAASVSTAYQLASARAHGCSRCSGRAREARPPRPVRLAPHSSSSAPAQLTARTRTIDPASVHARISRDSLSDSGVSARHDRAGWTRRWRSGSGTGSSSRRWTPSCTT
jgi:hypothetical protein